MVPCLLFSLVALITRTFSLTSSAAPPLHLRALLTSATTASTCLSMPCVYDGLTASLLASSPSPPSLAFLTGFGVAATKGYPDRGLLSLSEMTDAAHTVQDSISTVLRNTNGPPIPLMCDGDTGHDGSSASSIRRTIFAFGRANAAAVMIEDQVHPKRCGHVGGKDVVGFEEAVKRIKVACDSRDSYSSIYGAGAGPLILARTDARSPLGLAEAIRRCNAFRDAGADITFLEAPRDREEMRRYCKEVGGWKLANMIEGGETPVLGREELAEMGYTVAAYPLSLLGASIKAIRSSIETVSSDSPEEIFSTAMDFEDLKVAVGFGAMDEFEKRYQ